MNILFQRNQEVVFASFLIISVVLRVVYAVLVVKRLMIFNSFIWCIVDDIVYVFICGVSFISVVFVVNNGIIRWYEFLCCLCGFLIYKQTVSKVVLKIISLLILLIRRVILFILNIVLNICMVLFKPVYWVIVKILLILEPLYYYFYQKLYIKLLRFSFKKFLK